MMNIRYDCVSRLFPNIGFENYFVKICRCRLFSEKCTFLVNRNQIWYQRHVVEYIGFVHINQTGSTPQRQRFNKFSKLLKVFALNWSPCLLALNMNWFTHLSCVPKSFSCVPKSAITYLGFDLQHWALHISLSCTKSFLALGQQLTK